MEIINIPMKQQIYGNFAECFPSICEKTSRATQAGFEPK